MRHPERKKESPIVGKEGSLAGCKATRVEADLLSLDVHSDRNHVWCYRCNVDEVNVVKCIVLRAVLS